MLKVSVFPIDNRMCLRDKILPIALRKFFESEAMDSRRVLVSSLDEVSLRALIMSRYSYNKNKYDSGTKKKYTMSIAIAKARLSAKSADLQSIE